MAQPLRLLVIDDSQDDTLLLVRHLRAGGYEPQYERVDSAAGLIAALERQEWDLVCADYTIPGFGGMQALTIIRERGIDAPFLFVSGTIGEETAVDAMRLGAQDYIMKGNLRRLLPAIERELREAVVRQERRHAQERLSYLAHHDVLTGLPNRVLMMDRLHQALSEAHRHGRMVGMVFLDVDRFKAINDSLGHSVGDEVLKNVARRLTDCVREGDTVSRLSGDEFTLILADMAHPEDAARIAGKIMDCFTQPLDITGRELYVSASLGVALYPADASSPEELLRNADVAMYRAKESGRNTYQFYTAEMTARAAESLALENALRRALVHGEFLLHYQPVVDAGSGRIVAAEALLRWNRPQVGLELPERFIPHAEEASLIAPIGAWVLRSACTGAAEWRRSAYEPMRVAINLSTRQLQQESLAQEIERVLRASDLPSQALELEITESVLMQETATSHGVLGSLRDLGVRLTLDDFGTGYSSLSYLKRFPLDHLKIDRSFVRGIPVNADDVAIAQAIIAMAHRLGMKVVAEGVETRAQLDFLRDEGCDLLQGFLLCPPRPPGELTALLGKDSLLTA
jgi:diguanylate cyclase (GGDEF)-like protein